MELDSLYLDEEDSERKEKPRIDPAELAQAKEVIQHLTKTFSLLKMYPLDNPFIHSSIDLVCEKIREFLDLYDELKLSIEEFSFGYKGKIIFADEQKKKSLPFLFFKDGMREISFLKGLSSEEMQQFLEALKKEIDLPAEDSDVVNALWEKDFPNIRFLALDEFLNSDIGYGLQGLDKEFGVADPGLEAHFFNPGAIQLTEEDLKGFDSLGKEGSGADQVEQVFLSELPVLSDADLPKIDHMVSSYRHASHIDEFLILLFEILYLEDRQENFSATLDVVDGLLREMVSRSDFNHAFSLLHRLLDLLSSLPAVQEERKKLIEKILEKAKEKNSLAGLKELVSQKKVKDYDFFFQYLQLICPETIPLAAEIWEGTEDRELRFKASQFLEACSKHYLPDLLELAHPERISLTMEIINILARTGDEKVISHLIGFSSHPNKAVRLQLTEALGNFDTSGVSQILLDLLADKEEEIRLAAARHIKFSGNKTHLKKALSLARGKEFPKKTRQEKRAILHFLASTKEEGAYFFLHSLLKKSKFFFKKRLAETKLCVVYALEAAATPEALTILNEGTFLRDRDVRQASQLALKKIATREGVNLNY